MVTLEYAENKLDEAIKNGTHDDIIYWRGYRDAIKSFSQHSDETVDSYNLQ